MRDLASGNVFSTLLPSVPDGGRYGGVAGVGRRWIGLIRTGFPEGGGREVLVSTDGRLFVDDDGLDIRISATRTFSLDTVNPVRRLCTGVQRTFPDRRGDSEYPWDDQPGQRLLYRPPYGVSTRSISGTVLRVQRCGKRPITLVRRCVDCTVYDLNGGRVAYTRSADDGRRLVVQRIRDRKILFTSSTIGDTRLTRNYVWTIEGRGRFPNVTERLVRARLPGGA